VIIDGPHPVGLLDSGLLEGQVNRGRRRDRRTPNSWPNPATTKKRGKGRRVALNLLAVLRERYGRPPWW